MKFSGRFLLSSTLASSVFAGPVIQAANSDKQPASIYPIGKGGAFAKPAGRVFELDGKAGHFAGKSTPEYSETKLLTVLGSNAWWLAHLLDNSDVDLVLSQVANVSTLIVGALRLLIRSSDKI